MPPRESRIPAAQVAALFARDERTVKRWVAAGAPHRKVNGRLMFLLSELIPWRESQLRTDDKPDLAAEQARKMRADADLSELKVSQMRGDLVPAVDVEARMERLCAYVRARVLGVRGRWAPKVLGVGSMAEATAALDGLAGDILAALREGADELDEDEPSTDEVAA